MPPFRVNLGPGAGCFLFGESDFAMNVLDRERTAGQKPVREKRAASNGSDAQKYYQSVEFILEYITKAHDPEHAGVFVDTFIDRLRAAGLPVPPIVSTPYINTIPEEAQEEYPGDLELERRIKSYVRWNAMAMV